MMALYAIAVTLWLAFGMATWVHLRAARVMALGSAIACPATKTRSDDQRKAGNEQQPLAQRVKG